MSLSTVSKGSEYIVLDNNHLIQKIFVFCTKVIFQEKNVGLLLNRGLLKGEKSKKFSHFLNNHIDDISSICI